MYHLLITLFIPESLNKGSKQENLSNISFREKS